MTGAGNWRTLRRISLPLALPAVGAALLLLFVTAIETFEVPLLMGTRAGVRVYTTEIFYDTSRTPIDWGLAATYSMALLTVAIVLLFFYFRLIRHGERYQTITGKDYRPRRIDLGVWRYLTCAVSLLLVFLITGVPFLMMLYASLLPFYQAPSVEAFESMSLSNYWSLFQSSKTIMPMINSAILGPAVATAVILIVALIAYFVHKTQIRGRRLLDFLAFAPIAIPSVVLGATFFWFYLLVPVPILGTLIIIGLAYLTKYMPVALRFVSASMMQIHNELDEAAQVAGVSWARNFIKVTLPLLRGLLAAGSRCGARRATAIICSHARGHRCGRYFRPLGGSFLCSSLRGADVPPADGPQHRRLYGRPPLRRAGAILMYGGVRSLVNS
jgi:iron(III) transport system permease protein